MSFYDRLAQTMRAAGVSQSELAARTGIDTTNICHLMHGRRAPTLVTLGKILCALPDADARYLVVGKRAIPD